MPWHHCHCRGDDVGRGGAGRGGAERRVGRARCHALGRWRRPTPAAPNRRCGRRSACRHARRAWSHNNAPADPHHAGEGVLGRRRGAARRGDVIKRAAHVAAVAAVAALVPRAVDQLLLRKRARGAGVNKPAEGGVRVCWLHQATAVQTALKPAPCFLPVGATQRHGGHTRRPPCCRWRRRPSSCRTAGGRGGCRGRVAEWMGAV